MELNINPDEVQKEIVKLITETALGKAIEDAVNSELNRKEYYRSDSVIASAIKQEIRAVITKVIHEELTKDEHKEKVRGLVVESLTDDVLLSMTSAAIMAMNGELTRV